MALAGGAVVPGGGGICITPGRIGIGGGGIMDGALGVF